jgi:hypothetical protein
MGAASGKKAVAGKRQPQQQPFHVNPDHYYLVRICIKIKKI